MIKKLFFIFALLNISLASAKDLGALEFIAGGIKYEQNGATTVMVARNTAVSGAVTIPATVIDPDTLVEYSVTGITMGAFESASNLTSISIGSNVLTIGVGAFQECTGLTSITIPNSVTSIGGFAFSACLNLESVTLGNQLISIGNQAFSNCKKLATIVIPDSVTSAIQSSTFEYCTSLISVIIGNQVTSIEERAFNDCRALVTVNIPQSVQSIGESAFSSCIKLASVTIPNSVTIIEPYTFYNCRSLTTLRLPSTITSIGRYAFYSPISLKLVVCDIPTPLAIESTVFGSENQLDSPPILVVPSSGLGAYKTSANWNLFKTIYDSEPFSVDGLTYNIISGLNVRVIANTPSYNGSIDIPSSVSYLNINYTVKEIGEKAFYQCYSLNKVTIPNSVTSIGASAFSSCIRLTTINIPSAVTTIGQNAFDRCQRLGWIICDVATPLEVDALLFKDVDKESCRLNVPTTKVPVYTAANVWKAFTLITDVVPVVIDGITYEITPQNTFKVVASIPKYSETVIIPTNVNYEGSPYTVTAIGANAFKYSDVINVTIPSSITSIESGAFENCYDLKSIVCNVVTPLTIDASVFNSVYTSTCRLNVPTASLAAYRTAAYWSDFETIMDTYPFIKDSITYDITSSTTVKVIASSDEIYRDSVTIPTSVLFEGNDYSVTAIGANAFKDSRVTTVTIPNSITSIGNSAFESCYGLTSIICNVESPLEIEASVFQEVDQSYCRLNVPTSSLAAYRAAAYWKEFETISDVFPILVDGFKYDFTSSNTVKIIANRPEPSGGPMRTKQTTGYTGAVIIPASITYAGTTYSVTEIGTGAFRFSDLTSVSIPSSVTSIGNYAFANCSSLTAVICAVPVPLTIDPSVFDSLDLSNISLTVSTTSLVDYTNANIWSSFGQIITSTTLRNTTFAVANSVSIYPNPVSNELFLMLNTTAKTKVEVVDSNGRIVIQKSVSTPTSSVDTSNLATGIYFVKISSSEGSTTKKMIKN